MDGPPFPSDEEVTAAWLAGVPGLNADMVDEVLPPPVLQDKTPAPWVSTGFVTVALAGGGPDRALPVQRPVMQVDVWAVNPGSSRPPWRRVNALAQAITRATWDRYRIPRPLDIAVNGVPYRSASVRSAYMATGFRRVYGDSADYARLQGDLALTWAIVNDRIE